MTNTITFTYELPKPSLKKSTKTFTVLEVARKLGIGRNYLYKFLRQKKWVTEDNFANDELVAKNFILPKKKQHSGVLVTEEGVKVLKRLYKDNKNQISRKECNRVEFLDCQPKQDVHPDLMQQLYDLELLTIDLSAKMEECFKVAFATKN